MLPREEEKIANEYSEKVVFVTTTTTFHPIALYDKTI